MANWKTPSKVERREWRKFVKTLSSAVRKCIHEKGITPWKLYRLSSRGGEQMQRVTIASFLEPNAHPYGWGCPEHRGCECAPETFDEVTLTVMVSGEFNVVGADRRVGPILVGQLEECDLPKLGEPVGTGNLSAQEQLLPKIEIQRLLSTRGGNLRPYGSIDPKRN